MEEFEGKLAVVTGAASGIGAALARRFASEGMRVVLADVEEGPLHDVAATLAADGAEVLAVPTDVSRGEDVDRLAAQTAAAFGPVHVLCNNAGVGAGGMLTDLTTSDWEWVLGVNLWGVIHGLRAFLPGMMAHGDEGHIVNTASLAGLGPAPLLAPYAMTKHAVVGLSSSLRIEAKRYGVRVSVLCPAAIETPLLDSMNPADLKAVPWAPDIRRFLTNLAGPPYPADAFAEEALAAIARNRAVIVIPRRARLAWRLGRLFPGLAEKASEKFVTIERRHRSP